MLKLGGECTLPLGTVMEKKKFSEWHILSYKGKNAGEILLEVEWKNEYKEVIPHFGGPTPMMMGGGSGGQQPFSPTYGVSYMLPQMYMQQQQQPMGFQQQQQQQPMGFQQQPSPMHSQSMQQPMYSSQQMQQPMYTQQPMSQSSPGYTQSQQTFTQTTQQPSYVQQQSQPTYVQQQSQPTYLHQQSQPQQMYYAPPTQQMQQMPTQGFYQPQMSVQQGEQNFFAPPGY